MANTYKIFCIENNQFEIVNADSPPTTCGPNGANTVLQSLTEQIGGPNTQTLSKSNNINISTSKSAVDSLSISATGTAGTVDINGAGGVTIDSASGAISMGGNADAQAINVGTGAAARTITVGNTTSTTGVTLNAGTGNVNLVTGLAGLSSTWAPITPILAENTITAGTGGAIPITTYHTKLNTDAGGDAYTLADGAHRNQIKELTLTVDGGGDGVVTPANLSGGTTITFGDVGDNVVLIWNGSDWVVLRSINLNDGATAPVVA